MLLTPEITQYFKNYRGKIRSIREYKGFLITHNMDPHIYTYILWENSPSSDDYIDGTRPVTFVEGCNSYEEVERVVTYRIKQRSEE